MEAIELHRDLVVLRTVTNECSLEAHLIHCVWAPSSLMCSPPHVVHGYCSLLPVFHHFIHIRRFLYFSVSL